MARARAADRLRHILAAIARIEARTAGRTFEVYAADWVTCDVVERNLERISEVSRHISDELKARHSHIRWRPMSDLGNVLRHAYDRVADARIWQIVTDDLPPLKAAVEAMLREGEAGETKWGERFPTPVLAPVIAHRRAPCRPPCLMTAGALAPRARRFGGAATDPHHPQSPHTG